MRTAVCAALWSTLGSILHLEPCEVPVRHNALARLSYKPEENVQIVATLGKNDGSCLV